MANGCCWSAGISSLSRWASHHQSFYEFGATRILNVGISRRFFEKHYLPLLPFGLVASQVYAVQSAFLGYVESVIASLNFRETEFDEFIELVSFYVINRLRHYREEPVADVTPQWLKIPWKPCMIS